MPEIETVAKGNNCQRSHQSPNVCYKVGKYVSRHIVGF